MTTFYIFLHSNASGFRTIGTSAYTAKTSASASRYKEKHRRTHARTHARTHGRTDARTHTRAHARTHTHTYTGFKRGNFTRNFTRTHVLSQRYIIKIEGSYGTSHYNGDSIASFPSGWIKQNDVPNMTDHNNVYILQFLQQCVQVQNCVFFTLSGVL